jgi:hypothetical protein
MVSVRQGVPQGSPSIPWVQFVASLVPVPVIGAIGSSMASMVSFTALSGLYVMFSQRAHSAHPSTGYAGAFLPATCAAGVPVVSPLVIAMKGWRD